MSFCCAAATAAIAAEAAAGLDGNLANPWGRPGGKPATEATNDDAWGIPCVTVTEWGGSCAVVEWAI